MYFSQVQAVKETSALLVSPSLLIVNARKVCIHLDQGFKEKWEKQIYYLVKTKRETQIATTPETGKRIFTDLLPWSTKKSSWGKLLASPELLKHCRLQG